MGDAGDGTVRGVWDETDCQRFADRIQARIERLAPGFGARVLARRVLGPRELEARDANLIGGALDGGTAQLHQQLVFRPVPGPGPGRDAGAQPLPRVVLGTPRRRRPRGGRAQRGARGAGARPAAPAHAALALSPSWACPVV